MRTFRRQQKKNLGAKKLFLALIFGFFWSVAAWSQQTLMSNDVLPEIRFLSAVKDSFFQQHQELLELYHQAIAQKKAVPQLSLFRYTAKNDDTLFSLAGRFNLPYESIATLNRLRSAKEQLAATTLLIPSQPGLFLSLDHPELMDQVIASWRSTQAFPIKIPRVNHLESVLFFRGERFHAVERAFFLGILLRFPLPVGQLTSSFGQRINPFTGHQSFHHGIDIAAPLGTDVYAVRYGTICDLGKTEILGNYIRIDHGDGLMTIYGHLNKIMVSLNQRVVSSTIIGKIGSTGQSTGPHLHFEIHQRGSPKNPVLFFRRENAEILDAR